jgi:hypothetical protein
MQSLLRSVRIALRETEFRLRSSLKAQDCYLVELWRDLARYVLSLFGLAHGWGLARAALYVSATLVRFVAIRSE